jgi:hypothetical protein
MLRLLLRLRLSIWLLLVAALAVVDLVAAVALAVIWKVLLALQQGHSVLLLALVALQAQERTQTALVVGRVATHQH